MDWNQRMQGKVFNVLFLCTRNSARSILAEAQLNDLGKGRFQAFSAGRYPAESVHPEALEVLRHVGLPTEGLRSKSWDEFAQADSPHMDFVITLCDESANEDRPNWPGHPESTHWAIPDPLAVDGTKEQTHRAFRAAAMALHNRLETFISLPAHSLNHLMNIPPATIVG